MEIEYLNKIMSTSFSLRKVRRLEIMQGNKSCYPARPQLHVMLIAPFGTGKSSITKDLKVRYPQDIFTMDQVTKASMYGSITKSNDYIPSILEEAAGKLLIIDEWSTIGQETQTGMLSILENQSIDKALGFKVSQAYRSNQKNKYIKYTIKENIIKGTVVFSCIAYAMEYPVIFNRKGRTDTQKTLAIFSRFSPLHIEPTDDMIDEMLSGKFNVTITDYSKKIDSIVITQELYEFVLGLYKQYIEKEDLRPKDPNEKGIVARVFNDYLRMSLHSCLEKTKPDRVNVKIDLDYREHFINNLDFISTIFGQYKFKQKISKSKRVTDTLKIDPKLNNKAIARKLGLSTQEVRKIRKRIETRVERLDK